LEFDHVLNNFLLGNLEVNYKRAKKLDKRDENKQGSRDVLLSDLKSTFFSSETSLCRKNPLPCLVLRSNEASEEIMPRPGCLKGWMIQKYFRALYAGIFRIVNAVVALIVSSQID